MAGSDVLTAGLEKTARRLPGIRFVAQTPAPDEMLPRMDVAVFVGFAERCDTSDRQQTSSPERVFHLPVAVDSIEQYTRIFGQDLPLAWDPERREVVYAYLGPAVRAFFRNGGRRCWVIRVPVPTHFRAGVFLDPDLWNVPLDRLQADADTIRYQQDRPRALLGIHAALEIEEATIIAVPDAVHRPWIPMELAVVEPPDPSEPLPRPEWWHALPCDPPADPPAVTEPERGLFLARDLRLIAQPSLSATVPDSQGSFELTWDAAGTEDTIYLLEEATRRDWSDAAPIYQGPERRLALLGRSVGDYYFRVRAMVGRNSSDWSEGLAVRVMPPVRLQLAPAAAFQMQALVRVHRSLLRLCAVRGDLLAVLALPQHYRAPSTRRYRKRLLRNQPAQVSSYGAIYHPWLFGRETLDRRPPDDTVTSGNDLRLMPPDGAACGILARRALTRGAWVAPANEPINGVVALFPPIAPRSWQGLQDGQINLIRQDPRGFLALSADTLAVDPDLRPINVRRLLMLLRRLALRLGARYVFEPNSESFRRTVARSFERLLGQMYARGAFAGQTASSAYQVVADTSVNTVQSVEQGRFVVELKVAPSLPLTFVTVRLVQTNDRLVVTEGR